jgi:hypothetical protein
MIMNPREKNFLMMALAIAAVFVGLGLSQACPKGLSEKATASLMGNPAINNNPLMGVNEKVIEMCFPRITDPDATPLPGPCLMLIGGDHDNR